MLRHKMLRSVSKGELSYSYLSTQVNTNNYIKYSFTGVSLGDTSPGRRIVLMVLAASTSTGQSISTLTLGGVALTRVAEGNGPNDNKNASIWIVENDTDSTADIAIGFSGSGTDAVIISVYAVHGLRSNTPADTGAGNFGDPSSCQVDAYKDGVLIGGAWALTTDACSWTGLTADYNATQEGAARYSTASHTVTANESGRTVTADISNDIAMCVASWKP